MGWSLLQTFNFDQNPIMAQINNDGNIFAVSLAMDTNNSTSHTSPPTILIYRKLGGVYTRDKNDLNLIVPTILNSDVHFPEEISLKGGVLTSTITYGTGLSNPYYRSFIFNLVTRNDVNATGAVIAPMLYATGVKSFKIPHPIKKDTTLIHSCIEGPRCDLIYRGHVKLTGGTANVNIDSDSSTYPMTQGTFSALSTNARYFLQNNDSFDRVRGNLNGNLLTILSENTTSTDVITWMVISERKDNSIISSDRTDTNGCLIPEHAD